MRFFLKNMYFFNDKINNAAKQSVNSFKSSFPIMFGVLLLVSLVNVSSRDYYRDIFSGNSLVDSFIGSIAGSISFGIPITSYVVGGELLESGVSLLAITAFILAWSTVGLAMLPLEARFLGWRFSLIRNAINFVFTIVIAFLTINLLGIL